MSANPFQFTTELDAKLAPDTTMGVSGAPTINVLGETEVMTGCGTPIERVATGEIPPPGAGLVTVTASDVCAAWSATVTANVKVVELR